MSCASGRRLKGRSGGVLLRGGSTIKSVTLELMELENIVANTVYLKAREGRYLMLDFILPVFRNIAMVYADVY